jgi:hypothetical protein
MKGKLIREYREYAIKTIVDKLSDYKIGSKILLNTLKTIEYLILNCSITFWDEFKEERGVLSIA